MKVPVAEVEVEVGSSSGLGEDALGPVRNQLVLFEPLIPKGPGVITRTRSALALGKRLGLTYDCSDEIFSLTLLITLGLIGSDIVDLLGWFFGLFWLVLRALYLYRFCLFSSRLWFFFFS